MSFLYKHLIRNKKKPAEFNIQYLQFVTSTLVKGSLQKIVRRPDPIPLYDWIGSQRKTKD